MSTVRIPTRPLDYSSVADAVAKELLVDYSTGDLYVKPESGDIISLTQRVIDTLGDAANDLAGSTAVTITDPVTSETTEMSMADAINLALSGINSITTFSATITTTWEGTEAPYTQTISVADMLASYNPIINVIFADELTDEEVAAIEADWANITDITTADGSITVTSSAATTVEIPIALYINASYNESIPSVITATNVAVVTTDWEADATYALYPYKAIIDCSGVTAEHIPIVTFSVEDAISGIYAPGADTGADTVTIYASEIPSADITISSILCTKEGD